MSHLVDEDIFMRFSKQINYKDKMRKRKNERENTYSGKIENLNNEKFEKIKREAFFSINTESVNLKPGVVKNIFDHKLEEDKEEEEAEEEKEEEE